MSWLMPHLQYKPNWWEKFVDRCGDGKLRGVKGIGFYPNIPGVPTYGRIYLPAENQLVMMGAAGVPGWIHEAERVLIDNPHVRAWFGPNEFVVDAPEKADLFNSFHVALIETMHNLGIQHRGKPYEMAIGCTNTGWYRLPRYKDPEPWGRRLAPTVNAVNHYNGIWSFHEYDYPGMQSSVDGVAGPLTLRYRYNMEEWEEAGCALPQRVFIGECGIDHGVIDGSLGGWQLIATEDQYLEQLKAYSRELDKDPYIVGASIFTVCNWDWHTFNITESLAMKIADFIREDDAPPPPPPPPPPPVKAHSMYLSKYQETASRATLQALWDGGYRAIGFRVTGPNDPENPTYTEVDSVFLKLYPIAKEMGFLCYGFHYLHPALNNQARDFGRAVAGKTFELGLYGDVEHAGLDANRCARFFIAADRETGQTVDVYGRKTQLDAWRVSSDEGLWQEGRRLWIAAWTYDPAKLPDLPETWKDIGHEWHQWTNMAYLPATDIPDRVCLDAWRGTTEELLEEYGEENPVTDIVVDPRIAPFLTFKEDQEADYQIKEVTWQNEEEAAGLHHIFVDVVDPDGTRLAGYTVRVFWEGEHTDLVIEEKPGEEWGANFAMYNVLGSYNVHGGTDQEKSEIVFGLGLGTPEQPNFTIHTCFGVRFVVGGDVPPPPPPPPPDDVEIVDHNGDKIDGMTWQSVQEDYGVGLHRATPPEKETVYRLRQLILITTDTPLLRVFTRDENGVPIPRNLAFMGWEGGEGLPDNCAPHLVEGVWAQPDGRPNKALVYNDFDKDSTNTSGYVEWIWGYGQRYPKDGEGPHWSWIRAGDDIYSDVFTGSGVFDYSDTSPGGSMFWPVFIKEVVGDDDPETNGDLEEIVTELKKIVTEIRRIANAIE